MDFFSTMEPLLKMFWFVAFPASVIFLVQTIMTFVGADSMDGVNADFDGHLDTGADAPFQLFSLRNLINFLLGFGWTGVSFYRIIPNTFLLILVAAVVGVVFVALFFLIIKQLMKLAEDNSFNIQHTLSKSAEVYLAVPARRGGKGKVIVSVNGSVHELDAMTDGDAIGSNTAVKVVKVENNSILIVEKI